jgi:hypothetical protein
MLPKPRKKPEPRPVIYKDRDCAGAKVGWNRVHGCTGLYFVVDPPGKRHPDGLRRWMFRYQRPTNGRWNEIGVKHWPAVTLDQVRAAWMEFQFRLRRGEDPQEIRALVAANE